MARSKQTTRKVRTRAAAKEEEVQEVAEVVEVEDAKPPKRQRTRELSQSVQHKDKRQKARPDLLEPIAGCDSCQPVSEGEGWCKSCCQTAIEEELCSLGPHKYCER